MAAGQADEKLIARRKLDLDRQEDHGRTAAKPGYETPADFAARSTARTLKRREGAGVTDIEDYRTNYPKNSPGVCNKGGWATTKAEPRSGISGGGGGGELEGGKSQ